MNFCLENQNRCLPLQTRIRLFELIESEIRRKMRCLSPHPPGTPYAYSDAARWITGGSDYERKQKSQTEERRTVQQTPAQHALPESRAQYAASKLPERRDDTTEFEALSRVPYPKTFLPEPNGRQSSMWRTKDVIVISDLHLSSDKPGQGLFRADENLEQFLLWVYLTAPDSMVVLNGDVLDYLFAPDSPGLDAKKLGGETDAILQRHEKVFKAFGKLACSRRHQLVILSGNHDPEMTFPEVQMKIESRLRQKAQRPYVQWLVHGEALAVEIGRVKALIEHGNRLDAWNDIDHDKLNSAVSLETRGLLAHHEYQPPLGSQLVLNHLAKIRKHFTWAELLKPESEAMLPLLRYLMSFKHQANHSGAISLFMQAESKSRLTQLWEKLDPAAKYRAGEKPAPSISSKIKKMAQEMIQERQALKRAQLIKQLRDAARTGFFNPVVPEKSLLKDFQFLLHGGAHLLIHGHTHSAKAYAVGAGMYFNSGTWARLLALPGDDASASQWNEFLNAIEANSYQDFERPTYVRVRLEADGSTRATLNEWPHEEPLASKCFTGKGRWQDEKTVTRK
jgi:UDP-2,3-diacylglucosamine pyrophosphatase LpxH